MKKRLVALGLLLVLSTAATGCTKTSGIVKANNNLGVISDTSSNVNKGIVSDNVKSDVENVDKKQLEVASTKEINMGGLTYIRGWYGNDSLLTASDINSSDLIIKNLLTGKEKKVEIKELEDSQNSIVDYKNKKLLMIIKNNYCLYDIESQKYTVIHDIKQPQCEPRFIDMKGNYILSDNGNKFTIVNLKTGKSIIMEDAKLKDYNPVGVQGYPYVTVGEDDDSIYYTKGNSVYKTTLGTPSTAKLICKIDKDMLLTGMRLIKGEGVILASVMNRESQYSSIVINTASGKITELKNVNLGYFPEDASVNDNKNTVNRIIYDEASTKNGVREIYIGEIRGSSIAKARNILSKEISKENIQWRGSWNDEGSMVFVDIYKGSVSGVPFKYYLIDIN